MEIGFEPGLLLSLLSHFSRVQLCATSSLGFSRQEHWSGLPFPSPMLKSEKWKWTRSVMSDSSRPDELQPTRVLRSWDFPGKGTGVGCHCLLREPGIFSFKTHAFKPIWSIASFNKYFKKKLQIARKITLFHGAKDLDSILGTITNQLVMTLGKFLSLSVPLCVHL